MKSRILVTRPEPGATATGARLAARGYDPVLLPLTRIVASEPSALPDPSLFDVVAATSVNALRHAPAKLVAGLADLSFLAVGDRTAAAARQAGFSNVRSANGAAHDLARMITDTVPAGARLLHLTGTDRTIDFEVALEGRRIQVEPLELYQAQKVSYSTDFLQNLAEAGSIHGALVYSSRAGAFLAELADRSVLGEILENATFFCISSSAASALGTRWKSRVLVSPEPTEDAILSLLSARA